MRLTRALAILAFMVASGPCWGQDISKKKWVEVPAGDSKFYISLPVGFILTTSKGEVVTYEIHARDTTSKFKLFGGFYFGNSREYMAIKGDSCKTEVMTSQFLGAPRKWKFYKCGSEYMIQIVVENIDGEFSNKHLHAFGSAVSEKYVNDLLKIYETLREK